MGLKNNKGITLVEIIVSIAILGIIVTPLSSLFVTTVRNNSMARDKMIANQLAQKYMEEAMLDIKKGGTFQVGTKNFPDEGKFKITGYITEENNNYGVDTTTGDASIEGGAKVIGDSIIKDFNNSDELKLEINESNINLKKNESGIYSASHDQNPINIKLEFKRDNNLDNTIKVYNTSGKRVNIYKVYSKDGNDKVDIQTIEGEVYSYENICDDSDVNIENINKNYVYKIKIVVKKENKNLVEIASYKTND